MRAALPFCGLPPVQAAFFCVDGCEVGAHPSAMKYVITCLCLLTACAPSEPVDPATKGLIILHITGDDGAATNQVGTVTLTPAGDLSCSMTSPALPNFVVNADGTTTEIRPNGPASQTWTATFYAPGAYQPLADLIRENAAPEGYARGGDFMRLNDTSLPVFVSPAFEVFGLLDPRADVAVQIVNAATNGQCLQYG